MNSKPTKGGLALHEVRIAFEGVVALDDVSLRIEKPQVVFVVGENGAGKTTLFNAVSGFATPDSGSVSFAGHTITGSQPHVISKIGIGRLFQDARVYEGMTLLENLYLYIHSAIDPQQIDIVRLPETSKRVIQTAKEAIRNFGNWLRNSPGIEEVAVNALRHFGIEHSPNTIAEKLSFGQRKLLGVAGLTLSNPPLLLLDEPFAGLSSTARDQVASTIMQWKDQGHYILIIDHNLALVQELSDRIVLMRGGRVEQDSTSDADMLDSLRRLAYRYDS